MAASDSVESCAGTISITAAFVYVTDRAPAGGQRGVDDITASGGVAAFESLEVSDETACQQLTRTVLGAHGRLDVLVNNAGIGHVGTLLQTTVADLDRIFAVNVRGVFNLSKAFLPAMLERHAGNIINMASIGGVVAVRDRLAYCASKFAVVGLTKSIALDFALDGIRCNCICPGRVETPFVKARLAEYPDPKKAYADMASTQALGRMAKPEEIAAAALYLASDESGFITGSDFIIYGGWTVGK